MTSAMMDGLAALGWAVRVLVASPVLLGISAVAAVTRVVHFSVGPDRLGAGGVTTLEAVAGISRVALVLALFWVVQRRAGLSTDEAQAAVAAGWEQLRTSWTHALTAVGVVGLAAGAANGALWWAARSLTPGTDDTPTMLAVVFAVKNLTVIPLFMIALLRAAHLLRSGR